MDIAGQLSAGTRWFDIRPIVSGGQFYTGHYDDAGIIGTQGGSGQTIADIINQINAFTASYGELIILQLSNTFDTDASVGGFYPAMNSTQWTTLLNELAEGISHLVNINQLPPGTSDLSTVPLSSFISGGAAVIIIAMSAPSGFGLSPYHQYGIFDPSYLPLHNEYSNTDDVPTMSADQLSKMHAQRPSPDSEMFLLSWTLTQNDGDIVGTFFRSILDLAGYAYRDLYYSVWPSLSSYTYPNIITTDAVTSDGGVAALAMAVNNYLVPSCKVLNTNSKRDTTANSKRAVPFQA